MIFARPSKVNLKSLRFASHYITTPIFYVNSSPHIGHVHTILVADAINRYQKLKQNSNDTLFSSGTDEHGIKIQTAAAKTNIQCDKFCDINSNKFKLLFDEYETTITDFIRTTEPRHIEAVQTVWSKLQQNGFIYKTNYSGWYCTSDETFVPESQVTQDKSGEYVNQENKTVVWTSEENYLFKLSSVSSEVSRWLEVEKPVIPEKFNGEAINILKQSRLGDISVSRPKKRLSWGVEVPNDPSQTIYVWLDALTNYLTVVGYPCDKNQLKRWPIDCQVIGKDILKFHAIYWASFLVALSLPLPKRIICHSHWLLDSSKMSKSCGNVADPFEENKLFTQEGLRYYLLRSSTPHSDSDYNRTQAYRRINAELADTFGNLMSRCCSPAINPRQTIPTRITENYKKAPEMLQLVRGLMELKDKCENHYSCANFYLAIDEIMAMLRLNNSLYEQNQPWKLVKVIQSDEEARDLYMNLQALTFESLRICSILLQPIVPKIAASALGKLAISDNSWSHAQFQLQLGNPTENQRKLPSQKGSVLFSRLKPTLE